MQYTTEYPWDKIIVDAFVPLEKKASITRTLYEDDGLSPEYQKDAFRKTPVTIIIDDESFQLVLQEMRDGEMTCNCVVMDWFKGNAAWMYTAECPIHHHEDTQPGGIVPVEIEKAEKRNERT